MQKPIHFILKKSIAQRFCCGLFLLLLAMVPGRQVHDPSKILPNSPATIQSVTDTKLDIVETLVSVVTGLAATATDIMYMTTPSSLTAMSTNSALTAANAALQTDLSNLMVNPIKYSLTSYQGFLDPSVAISSTSNAPPFLNSGLLMLDLYNALDAAIPYTSTATSSTPPQQVSASLSRPNGNSTIEALSVWPTIKTSFVAYMQNKEACMNGTAASSVNCSDYQAMNDVALRQQILNAVFNTDSADSVLTTYATGDVYFNPEVLLAATSYAPTPITVAPGSDQDLLTGSTSYSLANTLIYQLSQFAGTPDPKPPGLPEPMTQKQVDNLNAQITSETGGPSTLDTIQLQQQLYTQAVMQMIAGKNMVMDNIYAIHAKRIPKLSIYNQQITDPTTQRLITSPRQLEIYTANRRLTPAYYSEMAGASPTAVSRETLFVLAEIRQQLFQNQLMAERMLATMSMLALSSMATKATDAANISRGIQTQISLLLSGGMNIANQLQGGNLSGVTTGSPSGLPSLPSS